MPTPIVKLNAVSSVFDSIGEVVIFAAPANYAVATVKLLTSPLSVGDIKLDSTTFNGEAPTETQVKNEKGAVVVSTAVAGTYKFEFTCLNTSDEMLTKFLNAAGVTGTFVTGDIIAAGSTMIGLGTTLPIVECPILVANGKLNTSVLFPKAKIVSSLVMDSKVLCIKCSVTAQNIDTTDLKTVMFLRGALNYTV